MIVMLSALFSKGGCEQYVQGSCLANRYRNLCAGDTVAPVVATRFCFKILSVLFNLYLIYMSYCSAIQGMQAPERRALHQNYHDHHYGFPLHDDNELFGRLIMEINQAGLSWETILKKEDSFRKAYSNFDIATVAAYKEKDRERLLADPGIIRNRLKVDAAIANANTLLDIQQEFGSFDKWLEKHHPLTKEQWVKLFKKTFRFTGGEIVGEFLMSIGYLPGAHDETCPVFARIQKKKPMWQRV